MLIVEGPDGVGKTTFCMKLLTALPTHVYAHFTRLPPLFDPYWGYRDRASRFVVQDRFHMSEIVYAAACGRATILPPERYRLVDGYLRLLGAYTVLVTAELQVVEDRWTADQMFSIDRTVEAARLFMTIDKSFADYRVDVDDRIHCTPGKPYPDEDDVNRVLKAYRNRQLAINNVSGRRPATLQAPGLL